MKGWDSLLMPTGLRYYLYGIDSFRSPVIRNANVENGR